MTQRKPIKDRRKRGRATLKRLRRRFVVVDFNGGTITTDAGSLLQREVGRNLGLIEMNNRRAEATTNVLVSMLGYSIHETLSAANF